MKSLSWHPLPISFCISSTSLRFSFRSKINAVPNAARAISLLSRSATSKGFEVKTETLGHGPTQVPAIPASSTFSALSNHERAVQLLPASNDTHGGVIVDMKKPMDPDAFSSSLKASIAHWRSQGKKGVWIKLPIELVNLVQVAVKEGFWYHHAEPTHLMLVYWIPETVHTLPPNATHRVGVGGFVMNDRREVLVVQEKGGKLRGMGVWKFPTGVVNEGEDIFAAVAREVKEETGVETEFVEVLAFRQSHKSFFEKSDLYFICMLRPLSSDIQKQESEIDSAQWMPIEEYAAQPLVQKHELFKYVADICLASEGKRYTGFSPVCTKSSLSGKVWNDNSDCQYPCSPYAPPAPRVYPSPGAPPPPPPSLPGTQDNCPPVVGVACCQFPPPTPTNTPSTSLPYYRNSAQHLHLSSSPSAGFLSCCFILFFYGILF